MHNTFGERDMSREPASFGIGYKLTQVPVRFGSDKMPMNHGGR